MPVVGEATLELRGDSASLERALERANAKFQRVGAAMQRQGRMLSTRLTLPLLGIGGAAVRTSARFEESMSRITGLVGIAADQVDAWGRDILELAPRLGRAPQELAEGLFFVTSAGFRGAAAMEVLEQAGRAAAAGLGSTRTVADAVTSAVNAYGAENLSAAQAVDIMTAAVREGKLEAESLAPVLGNLLPTASAMEIGFEQVAGLLAVFSRTGADAASSATTLNRLMLTLQKNTGPAVDMLENAGLSLAKLRQVARGPQGLIGVMRLLNETFADDEEALAQIFPNIRAFRGVMNALAQDTAVVDKILGGVANSAGSADRAFEAASRTGAFRLHQAFARIRVVAIRVGGVLLPLVADVAEKVSGALARLSPQALRTGVAIGIVAAALGPLLLITGGFVRTAGLLVGAVGKVGGAFAVLVSRLGPVLTGLKGVGLLANPVTLGLAAMAAAIITITGHWRDVGRFAARAWEVALEAGRVALTATLMRARIVINALIGLFRFLGSVAAIVWDEFVAEKAKAAWEIVRRWAEPVLTAVAKGLELLGRLAERAAEKIKDFFKDAARGGDEEGATLGSRIAAAAVESFGTDYVGAFVDVVRDGIEKAKALIRSAMSRLGGGVGGGGGEVAEQLAEAQAALENALSGLSDITLDVPVKALDDAKDAMDKVDRAAFALEQGLSGVFDSLITGAMSFADAMKNMALVFIREVNRMLAKALALKILGAIFDPFRGALPFVDPFTGIVAPIFKAASQVAQGPALEPVTAQASQVGAVGGAMVVQVDPSRFPRPMSAQEAARQREMAELFAAQVEEHLNSGGSF